MPTPDRSKARNPTRGAPQQPPHASLTLMRARLLTDLPWLIHGFSTRQGGTSTCYGGKTLNLALTQHDAARNVEHNRVLFETALGAIDTDGRTWPLIQARQIHSALVQRVNAVTPEPIAGDGLITSMAGILLAIKTADCVPVLAVDAKRRVIAAFHAGWRGSVARIVEKGIGEMRRQFGSLPRDLRAAIGPCIRRCCYVVGPEVQAEFQSQFSYADELFHEEFDYASLHVRYPMLFLNQRAPGHGDSASEIHLDLVEANRRQLEDAGLLSEHIELLGGCTYCDTTRFFSHRAEHGKTGRMMAAIGIKPE